MLRFFRLSRSSPCQRLQQSTVSSSQRLSIVILKFLNPVSGRIPAAGGKNRPGSCKSKFCFWLRIITPLGRAGGICGDVLSFFVGWQVEVVTLPLVACHPFISQDPDICIVSSSAILVRTRSLRQRMTDRLRDGCISSVRGRQNRPRPERVLSTRIPVHP